MTDPMPMSERMLLAVALTLALEGRLPTNRLAWAFPWGAFKRLSSGKTSLSVSADWARKSLIKACAAAGSASLSCTGPPAAMKRSRASRTQRCTTSLGSSGKPNARVF